MLYSLYNFLRYFRKARKLFISKKIVFVGRADFKDTIESIKILTRSDNIFTKKFCDKIIDDLNSKQFAKSFSFEDILKNKDFKNLYFYEKYYISNAIIRHILIKHLNKFNVFYHKNNSKYPLDLLNSNVYKNLIHIELGSKVGNSEIYSRRIMINKFYPNSFIKINFFKNNINYNDNNLFEKRLLTIDKFFSQLHSYDNYNMGQKEMKKILNDLNSKFLNRLDL